MDCSPLNLAHFHERRAEKFLKHHRFDDAYKAIETSLLYVQDAFKNALISKSIEVLNTQKWDYERKLCQIKMRQLQHERLKLKEIVPMMTDVTNSALLKPESSVTAMSISKSIDKTIEDFDAKFNNMHLNPNQLRIGGSKENQDPKLTQPTDKAVKVKDQNSMPAGAADKKQLGFNVATPTHENDEDFPSLAPLELPSFDFNMFTSAPSLGTMAEVDIESSDFCALEKKINKK